QHVQSRQRVEQMPIAEAPQPPRADARVEQNRLALALDHETQHTRSNLRVRVLATDVRREALDRNLIFRAVAQMRVWRGGPVTIARDCNIDLSDANGFLHSFNVSSCLSRG